MNIANILKCCPKGTKLYSTVHGEVTLMQICENEEYPIHLDVSKTCFETLTKEGQFYENQGECVLFPSEKQRDWNKFRIPVNKGDFIVTRDNLPYIVDKYEGNRVKIICGIHESKEFLDASSSTWYIVKDYIPAPLNVKLELLDIIKANGFIWNANTLQLEKIEKENFKPFDKVLVRNVEHVEWRISLFSSYSDEIYKYKCINGNYKYCIPYEGNEHLVGTNKNR
jgi:hypothetical protein